MKRLMAAQGAMLFHPIRIFDAASLDCPFWAVLGILIRHRWLDGLWWFDRFRLCGVHPIGLHTVFEGVHERLLRRGACTQAYRAQCRAFKQSMRSRHVILISSAREQQIASCPTALPFALTFMLIRSRRTINRGSWSSTDSSEMVAESAEKKPCRPSGNCKAYTPHTCRLNASRDEIFYHSNVTSAAPLLQRHPKKKTTTEPSHAPSVETSGHVHGR